MYTEKLYNYIENNLKDYEVIMLNNELALENRDDQAYVYNTEDCFEYYAEWVIAKEGVISLMNHAFFGTFNPNDEYYYFNGYENLMSLSEYDVRRFCLENIEDMIDNDSEFVYDYLVSIGKQEELEEYFDS